MRLLLITDPALVVDTQIEQVDTRTAPESLLREMHEHYIGVDAEQLPDDPPRPFEHRLAIWRFIPEHHDIRRWILREGSEIAGAALLVMNKHEDLNNGLVRIDVRPESRQRGLALRLALPVLETLAANDRASLITDVLDGSPWEPKLEVIVTNCYNFEDRVRSYELVAEAFNLKELHRAKHAPGAA